jgi:hypothetical protein
VSRYIYFLLSIFSTCLVFGEIQVHGSEDFEGQIRKSSRHMRKHGSSYRRINGEALVSNSGNVTLVFLIPSSNM